MFLESVELTPFATADQGVGVRYDSEPIELLPICFTHKHVGACVTVTDPRVNVLKNNTSFVWQYTTHQSVVGASLEQLIINHSIMPCPTTQSFTFVFVLWQAPVLRYIMNGVLQSE
jgi:hypothetical protein